MKTRAQQNRRVALLFLLPNAVGFGLFTLVPVLMSFGGSFTSWSLRPSVPLEWIGLENFGTLLRDRNFYFYLYNTLHLMLAAPVSIAGSLFLALWLHRGLDLRRPGARWRLAIVTLAIGVVSAGVMWLAGRANVACLLAALGTAGAFGFMAGPVAYRTLFYLPSFTAGAATALLWTQLFNPDTGLINQTLGVVGMEGPKWLASTKSLLGFLPWPDYFNNGGFGFGAREALMLMSLWASVGGSQMVLYLAALSNVPAELYEAASIDGASAWQRFRHITWPELLPTTFFIVIMAVINGLQGGFEQARIMTEGGPARITTTVSYYIYQLGFERLDLGYGSAVAWALFTAIFALTLINWRYGQRRDS